MTVYFVYGVNTIGGSMRNAPIESEYLAAGMKAAGAVVMEEREFVLHAHRDHAVANSDKVIGFFTTHENSHLVFSPVEPQNRWSYVIDTKILDDGSSAYRGRVEYCQQFDINHVVVTYVNPQHLRTFRDAGISYMGMPHCVPSRRKRTSKPAGILLSGTFHERIYPTRNRLRRLLEGSMSTRTQSIVTSDHGSSRPTGPAYYDIVDQYEMGVVCRSGTRDYFVAKYVEFGMCHVLPVGDCPSYMPDEMKQLMVDVEGLTDEQVVAEVSRLLRSPDELHARQEAYCEATHRYFDLLTNAQRVVRTISTS